jgi:hypothetical protein
MTREYTALFDYQEFCELLDHIQDLKFLASQSKSNANIYRKKIEQICERVERDFCDNHHFFACWVDGKPLQLASDNTVVLSSDRQVIFVLLILNRRKELGLPVYQSDINEFYKLCKNSQVEFPKYYFIGA